MRVWYVACIFETVLVSGEDFGELDSVRTEKKGTAPC